MLDKRLKLGGLQVGGSRTKQNSARFRVANNVYQTLDEYMVPRGEVVDLLTLAGVTKIALITRYKDKIFAIGVTAGNAYAFFYDGVSVISADSLPTFVDSAHGIQAIEKQGCLFLGLPFNNLLKFDGVQVTRAGVPLPYFYCDELNTTSGTTWVRVLQHHVDFQANQVYSGYIQFPVVPVSSNIQIDMSKLVTSEVMSIPSVKLSPRYRPSYEVLDRSYDTYYFKKTGSLSVNSSRYLVVPTSGKHYVKVGCRVVVYPYLLEIPETGLPEVSYALAMKVDSFNASQVVFDLNDVLYLDRSKTEWKSGNISGAMGLYLPITNGANFFISVWTSDGPTNSYALKAVSPVFYEGASGAPLVVGVSSPTVGDSTIAAASMLNISPIMGDFYAVTSVKSTFPRIAGEVIEGSSITTYQDSLLLMSYKHETYFSDTSLGGSFEMVNGISFITVGEERDGTIQAICGTADMLLVSRQFKNFYLSGNLPTANYRVQEISSTPLGAYSNESAFAMLNKIMFFNRSGVWALYPGGKCEEVSFNVRGFFDIFSGPYAQEEAYFDLSSFGSYATAAGKWVKVRADVRRNLLVFAIKSGGTGQALVLNMGNGEIYTWGNLSPSFSDILFLEDKFYVASGLKIRKEDRSVTPSIPTLVTTWFTAGEPSLEKKVKQVKIWGAVEGSVDVTQYVDWKQTAESVGSYANVDASLYSHKKTLRPANALAFSVGLGFSGTRFELEGLELEFDPFQMGMKR